MANNQSTFTQEFGYLIDQFDELQDLRWSDLQYLDEYRELKMKKNDGLPIDQNRLDDLEEIFKNKIVTSARWNKFQNALVNMQTFIKTEIEGYVLDKQQEMETFATEKKGEVQTEIDKFQHKGTYNPSIQYYQKNTVDFDDGTGSQVYIALKDTKGNDPTNSMYWKKLTIQGTRGEKGFDGVGLKFKGEYKNTTIYAKDDGVQFGGVLFASLIDGNLDNQPDLTQDTPYWAKALDVTVTVRKMIGTRNIATQSSNVNFMTGEITSFNPAVDSLEVYQNSVRLTKGVDYNINPNNQSIDKIVDIWNASPENTIFFEFVVTKNVLNDLVFSDGSAIQDGTIAKSKLTTDVQEDLVKIGILTGKVSPETPLSTTSQDLSGAVNELNEKIGDISLANNIKNFVVSSINQGAGIRVTWENGEDTTFLKNELFISTNDLTNADIEYCKSNATNIYTGKNESFEHATNKNILYYLKIFTSYSIGGEIYTSKGVSIQILTEDKTPPAPVTNIEIEGGDKFAIITYTPPTDSDYMGTRLVYRKDGYPSSITDGTDIASYTSGTKIPGLTNDEEYFFRLFSYDTSGNYNTSTSQQISVIPKAYQLYGVKIDTNNSNPETAVTYTDMATDFTPAFCNNGNWQMGSWENKFPYDQIKPCLLKNGVVNYYLNPNDYTKKLDGSSADITSGNDGDVMIEFPKLYWKFETIGTDLYVRYSDVQIDSEYKCLAHTVGTTTKDKIYLPAYKGFSTGGKLRSLSGKTPTGTQTIGQFRTLAQANGSGYQQMCYYPLLMLQVLAIVMGKNRDSQTQLGRGYVDGNSAAITTGNTNTKGMFYGENTGKQQNKFCGMEDFYGNLFTFIDGMYSDASRNMMISNQNVFNDTGSGYVNYGIGASANVNGYVGSVQGGTETGFIIKTSNGSATTHYADYGNLSGGFLPAFGGYWDYGDHAGAFALRVNLTASYSYANFGGSLIYLGT